MILGNLEAFTKNQDDFQTNSCCYWVYYAVRSLQTEKSQTVDDVNS
ncbi:hypothetical protein [Nostoc sp.]